MYNKHPSMYNKKNLNIKTLAYKSALKKAKN